MYVSVQLIYNWNQFPQQRERVLLRLFTCLGGAGTLTKSDHFVGNGQHDRTAEGQNRSARPKRRSRMTKLLRGVLAFTIGLVLIAALGIGLLFFLLQGRADNTSAVAERVQVELQNLVGENFAVKLGDTHLDFSDLGRMQLSSDDIRITEISTGQELANIGQLKVGVQLLGLLKGDGGFDRIKIEKATIDTGVLSSGQAVLLPKYLDEPLDVTGATFARMNQAFLSQSFQSFEIANSQIVGPVLGRRNPNPINVSEIRIAHGEETGFVATGRMDTDLSDVVFSSTYSTQTDGQIASDYRFQASGINLMEWLENPESETGFIASDAMLDVSGVLPFDGNNNARDPEIRIVAAPGAFRVGDASRTDIKSLDLNFRLILDLNQVELDPSQIAIGGLTAKLIGGLKPEDDVDGYHGAIRYDMVMKYGVNEVKTEGEQPVAAAFKFAGVFDRLAKAASLERMIMTTKTGLIEGTGRLGFSESSPAIQIDANTKGISVAALKQFWPFFVAKGARKWMHEHVLDGWIGSGVLKADIPAGVIQNLKNGAKLKPEEYDVVLNVEKFEFRPFGDLPPIKNAKGKVKLQGMKVLGSIIEGVASVDGGTVKIESANFAMEDFAAKERWGEAELELSGGLTAIAAISDREPLRVMKRMKVKAAQFSGKGHANIAARFPVGRKSGYNEINWNVLLDMEGGKSTRKLAGRVLSNADLLIDASPTGAQVTGTMNIDGIKSRVNMIEPIGNSGKVKRKRTVTSTLDKKGRKKLGINLGPVLEGPVGVKIIQEGKIERYELDFENAKLNLPWVGWSKGNGIASKGSFVLKRLKTGVRLEKFTLTGSSFTGKGVLEIDKRGLAFADLSKLSLNEGDDMRLKVERTKTAYNINASGLSYDARGLLNTLIYKASFSNTQKGRSVNLVANFEKVKGFGNRIVRNVVMIYDSVNGQLKKLDLRGVGSQGRKYGVQAQHNGNDTLFTVKTNDAGTALAFMDIYTRMQGGEMEANLLQGENGPYVGPVKIKNFVVVNEPRLKSIASSAKKQIQTTDGEWERTLSGDGDGDKKVRFQLADALIERGKGFFNVKDAIIRSTGVGIAMEGVVYDENDRMNLTGTFMPANGVNLVISRIPLLGQLFSDGKKNALIGITYKLQGPRSNPEMLINPLSVVAPGIFKKVFEFN